MADVNLIINKKNRSLTSTSAFTLLDILREKEQLFGTKEGCREGECGACTVLIGRFEGDLFRYRSAPSCLTALGQVNRCHVVSIEGLNMARANPFQQAMIDRGASQCGFCTPGFILSFTAYLLSRTKVSLQGAMDSLDGNICRCTGYQSIKRALKDCLTQSGLLNRIPSIEDLIKGEFIPPYFKEIPEKIKLIPTEEIPRRKETSTIIAGGTDLLVQKGDELSNQEVHFVQPGTEEIIVENREIFIPASATFEQLRQNDNCNRLFPGLKEALKVVASTPLRNRATLAGNIVNASPIADGAVLLLSWNSEIELSGPNGNRTLALQDFFLDYKKLDLRDKEEVKAFRIRQIPQYWHFRKVSKRERLDIASCNSSFCFDLEDNKMTRVRLSFGGVAPVPFLARQSMKLLEGAEVTQEILTKAQKCLSQEISPISDIRGMESYKRKLAEAILEDHFQALFPELFSEKGGLS